MIIEFFENYLLNLCKLSAFWTQNNQCKKCNFWALTDCGRKSSLSL